MTLHVVVARQADADVDSIVTWLANRSQSGAKNWYQALQEALVWLGKHAPSCGLAPENEYFADEVRQHFFKTRRGRPYRLLFAVVGGDVRVLHVRGPGQNLIHPE